MGRTTKAGMKMGVKALNASASKGAGEVRIIGGMWKRTKLPVLPVAQVMGLRPTPSRVRETLFNWLGQDLQGWRCLDVFAGTGALGFEAASRGAGEVVLVEKNRNLAAHLQGVCQKLDAENVRVVCADGMKVLQACEAKRWDLIFLDPPFDADLFDEALQAAKHAVTDSGAIYLEASRTVDLPTGLSCWRHAQAGAVYYYLFMPNH